MSIAALICSSHALQDFLVSVLETSITKRDARAYIKKFVPLLERKGAASFKQQAVQSRSNGPTTANDTHLAEAEASGEEPLMVALVKFRAPHEVDNATLLGVAKTLSLLKKLGLLSIVVVDSDGIVGSDKHIRHTVTSQAARIAAAIDEFDDTDARIIDYNLITIGNPVGKGTSPYVSEDLFVSNSGNLLGSLQQDRICVIPSIGCTENSCTMRTVDANDVVLALSRQLSGMHFVGQPDEGDHIRRRLQASEVYRLIVLDPLGGIPARNRATGRYMFLNLEQEYEEVTKHLSGPESGLAQADSQQHLRNAQLARKTLSLLPPTSSAIITTPHDAANQSQPEEEDTAWPDVATRRKLNPLLHNLLSDKPALSSSLPPGRLTPVVSSNGAPQRGSLTTLAKRGMPLTIFPDPRTAPWRPPQPGERRLSLTDPCVDLARLVHLINDSFGRKLDVDHYLKRVDKNIAGLIIAGEYEGCAILTWEKPFGSNGPEDAGPARMVPYLDKFAVLRKSQGAGGVADIVFNAMVRDCFPEGVCWRSRKDNPVNKWYFERSRGTVKLDGMNWTMFWTTPELSLDRQKYMDYESVCRGVEPSWADKKHIVD